MTEEEAIKIQARFCAIEYAICELFSVVYQHIPAPQLHERHDHWIDLVRSTGIYGVHPVESDLLSGEIEIALHDLSRLIEKHVQKPRPMAAK